MNRYGRLGKNIAFITIGNFASKILSFLMVPFYTAILSTEEFGVADLMTTTVNLIMPFFTLLISEALLRFALDKQKDKAAVLTTGLALFLAGSSVFLLLSPLMLFFREIKGYYWLFVAYYFATVLHSVLAYFTRGIDKVGVYAFCGVLQTLITLSLNILLLAVVRIGVTGYLCAMIIGSLCSSLCLFVGGKLYRYIRPKTFDRGLLGEMLRYCGPMIPNSLSWWISNSSDKYLLTFICGVSVTGIYSVAQKIPTLFATISTIFMGAWNISAVEDFGSKESEKFFSNVYRCYMAFNLVVVSGIICITKPLAGVLFANDFYDGWRFVPILVVASMFHGMSGFLGSVYTAAKQTKMLFVSTLIAAAVNIAFNALLIPLAGGYGAAIATLVSYFAIWLIRLIDSRRIMVIGWNKITDIISFVLLGAQAILLTADFSVWSCLGTWAIFAVVALLNGKQMLQIVMKFLKK